MTKKAAATTQIDWLNRINALYGAAGLVALVGFGANGSWKSFAAGWLIAVANLELLKRIGKMLLALYEHETQLPLAFYFVILAKFGIWGAVLALFSTASWLKGIPFLFGLLTLLVSGAGLGTREFVYARRT